MGTDHAPQVESSEWEILEAMLRYGGNFVRHLALLYRAGDETNRRKLANTFAHYFEEYDEIATKARRSAGGATEGD